MEEKKNDPTNEKEAKPEESSFQRLPTPPPITDLTAPIRFRVDWDPEVHILIELLS